MNNIVDSLREILKNTPRMYDFFKFFYRIYRYCHDLPTKISLTLSDFKKILKYREGANGIRCWLMCIPIHANLGDQAMAYSAEKWIKDNYPEHDFEKLTNIGLKAFFCLNTRFLSRIVNEDDIIFIQGGYTTGDNAFDEKVHRLIANRFNNKIIFFPQTVFYSNENEKNTTANYFNKNGKILFLARDQISYNTVFKSFYNINVDVFPDIVSSLINREVFEYKKKRSGILFCMRKDAERKYSEKSIDSLKIQVAKKKPIDTIDLMYSAVLKDSYEYYTVIRKLITKISGYEIVVTDRFHGIVFSILSHTPVIALDSADFKVREGVNTFSALLPNSCYYAKCNDEVLLLIEKISKTHPPINYSTICYDNYYKSLKMYIDKI